MGLVGATSSMWVFGTQRWTKAGFRADTSISGSLEPTPSMRQMKFSCGIIYVFVPRGPTRACWAEKSTTHCPIGLSRRLVRADPATPT